MGAALTRLRRLRERLDSNFRFFQDFGLLTFGQVLSRILSLIAFAWIARVLHPADYGALEFVVTLSLFFATLADGGLGVLGTRRAANNPAEIPLLAFQIPLARFLIVLIGLPIMAVTAAKGLGSQIPSELVWLFAASVVTTPLRQQWLFQATGRMSIVAWGDTIRMAVFAIMVWSLVRDSTDLLHVGYAEVISVAAVAGYSMFMQHRHVTPFRMRGSMAGFGTLLRDGATIGSGNLVWALNQSLALFMIGFFLGNEELAWFGGASRIVVSIMQFGNLYHFNMYPSVARAIAADDGSLGPLLARSTRFIAWASIGCATMLTVLDKQIVWATLGTKLLPMTPVFDIVAWSLPIAFISGHARWSLAAAGAQTSVLISQIVGLIATLLTGFALGHVMGVTGYAVASVIGFLAVWVVSHHYAAVKGCVPPPIGMLVPPAALAAAVVTVARLFDVQPWGCFGLLVFAGLLAPLIDRKLVPDMIALARTRTSAVNT